MAPLAGMPRLRSLFVSWQFNGRLTDAGLKHLVQIQTLESLKLAEFVIKARMWGKHPACLSIHRGKRKLEAYATETAAPRLCRDDAPGK